MALRVLSWSPILMPIAGNHDYCLDKDELFKIDEQNAQLHEQAMQIVKSGAAREAGLTCLEDSMAEVQTDSGERTWKIWGSPRSAAFRNTAFNAARGESLKNDLCAGIPDDIDVLMSHGPPYGISDKTRRGGGILVGCTELAARTKDIRPRLHCWGHIHEDRGAEFDPKTGTVYVNAANAGNFAEPRVWGTGSHQPIVVGLVNDVQCKAMPSL